MPEHSIAESEQTDTVIMSAADIYANAKALSVYLRDKAAEIDEARRLPKDVAARLRDAGMFRLMMPKEWGGPEMCPAEQVEIIEELAKANASAAWCVMIGCDSGFFAGFLEDQNAREVYPRLDMATAGSAWPTGRAERVPHGYRVTGEWSFGSGITHAEVVELNCVLYENGAPILRGRGTPLTSAFLTPTSNVEVIDNWHTTGLQGTGSNDYRVNDLFVPERFQCDMRSARRTGVLWRSVRNFLPKVAGVPLGAARAAIDYATESLAGRVEKPSGHPYRNNSRVQSVIAEAEMKLGAARSYVFLAMENEWKRLEQHEEPTIAERADSWLSRINAGQAARDVIRMVYDLLGANAIYSERTPMDRALRDADTFCQHIILQQKSLETAGAMLLKADRPSLPFI